MNKWVLHLGLFLVASVLCSACGLKNDLYLPEENQAVVQLTEPSEDFGLELIVANN